MSYLAHFDVSQFCKIVNYLKSKCNGKSLHLKNDIILVPNRLTGLYIIAKYFNGLMKFYVIKKIKLIQIQ